MGNGVVWKPSDTAILSNYLIYKIFRDAGFPDGVVNFVPADGPVFGNAITAQPELAAINFTGSVPAFQCKFFAFSVGKVVKSNILFF